MHTKSVILMISSLLMFIVFYTIQFDYFERTYGISRWRLQACCVGLAVVLLVWFTNLVSSLRL